MEPDEIHLGIIGKSGNDFLIEARHHPTGEIYRLYHTNPTEGGDKAVLHLKTNIHRCYDLKPENRYVRRRRYRTSEPR